MRAWTDGTASVMGRIVELLRRFRRDESGAFAVIFAAVAIALIAMGGAAVDFTSLQQARTRSQVALDAAALALQPTIYSATTTAIQDQAQALLVTQLADGSTTWVNCTANGNKAPCVTVATPVVDTTNGQLTLTANLLVPMNFVTLVGVQQIPAQILSMATRKKLNLEVAMVLDNSGSMSTSFGTGTRMSTLIAAANCASNILFYSVTTCGASTTGLTANANVKLGLVPFTMEVNVGTANATAPWMDRTGSASGSITDDNFDNDDNPTTVFAGVDRIALFTKIKDSNGSALSWGGCVEARKAPYDTDDTTPTSSNPDTLFTPFFNPDEPGPAGSAGSGQTVNTDDTFYGSYISDTPAACTVAPPSCVEVQTKANCSDSRYSRCGSTAAASFTLTVNGTTTHPTSCSFVTNLVPGTTTTASSGSGSNITDTQTTTYASNRALQERLCKYTGSRMSNPVSVPYAFGPNSDCPANAITPLTTTPGAINTAIGNMTPQGGTNITEGAAWGLRVLSPSDPFSEGSAYSNSTSKVMILMTDGENYTSQYSNMNDSRYYSAYGYPWNSTENGRATNTRLGAYDSTNAQLLAEMNSRLTTVCTNAKALGITVYTIGLATNATSDPTGNATLLTNCASASSDAYFPPTATALQDDFVAIAKQLAALRLAE